MICEMAAASAKTNLPAHFSAALRQTVLAASVTPDAPLASAQPQPA